MPLNPDLQHDLRSPLTAIAGMFCVLEASLGDRLGETEREVLAAGRRSLDRLVALIDSLPWNSSQQPLANLIDTESEPSDAWLLARSRDALFGVPVSAISEVTPALPIAQPVEAGTAPATAMVRGEATPVISLTGPARPHERLMLLRHEAGAAAVAFDAVAGILPWSSLGARPLPDGLAGGVVRSLGRFEDVPLHLISVERLFALDVRLPQLAGDGAAAP